MDVKTDIDIDFLDRGKALEGLTHVAALEARANDRRKHQSGVYFHDIPMDPIDGLAVWDYQEAEQKGYFKIDFLNNTIYKDVRDEEHLIDLLVTEPPWDVFQDRDIVAGLAHVSRHFDILQKIKPKSIEDLAICIALVRPGKAHLIHKSRQEIDQEIWTKADKFAFKRAHGISYAATIVVQLNLLVEKANA
jgi:hypothetical protein